MSRLASLKGRRAKHPERGAGSLPFTGSHFVTSTPLKGRLSGRYTASADAVVFRGDCRDLLDSMPSGVASLIATSPPYNLGKEYERRRELSEYLGQQTEVIDRCVRVMRPDGHLCWQVGNYVDRGEVVPLDSLLFPVFRERGLRLRNRIVWHFEHGLHCSRRFSGRYEVVLWFTKSDDYHFDLDAVRVPQKYPGKKHFKGPRAGEFSCNPLGKNPGDVWVIPNVKHNHVEKTEHPCQFPVELIERLVLSMTRPGELVLDPFLGVGTTIVAAARHGRRGAGAEIVEDYCDTAERRIRESWAGTLRTREMGKQVYRPGGADRVAMNPFLSRANGR